MPTTLDRPPKISPPTPPARRAASPPPPEPRGPRRNAWRRYQQHAWIAGIAVLAIAAAALPMLLQPQGSPGPAQTPAPARSAAVAPAANLTTSVSITASEFKFSPNSIQVPVGQKVTFTLNNTGAVEHDLTIPGRGLHAAGQSRSDRHGRVHLRQGGRVRLRLLDSRPQGRWDEGHAHRRRPERGAPRRCQQRRPGHGRHGRHGRTSMADIKPLPANLQPLAAPQVAPPITRTEPAYVKFDLTTHEGHRPDGRWRRLRVLDVQRHRARPDAARSRGRHGRDRPAAMPPTRG